MLLFHSACDLTAEISRMKAAAAATAAAYMNSQFFTSQRPTGSDDKSHDD